MKSSLDVMANRSPEWDGGFSFFSFFFLSFTHVYQDDDDSDDADTNYSGKNRSSALGTKARNIHVLHYMMMT